jgi:hypothetical protein
VLIGFELPQELPRLALLDRAAWASASTAAWRTRGAAAPHRRSPAGAPAAGLHAPSTPDRGTLRFIEAARAGSIALLLLPRCGATGALARLAGRLRARRITVTPTRAAC